MIKKIKVFIKKQNGRKACLFDNFACFSVFFFKRTLFDFCKKNTSNVQIVLLKRF